MNISAHVAHCQGNNIFYFSKKIFSIVFFKKIIQRLYNFFPHNYGDFFIYIIMIIFRNYGHDLLLKWDGIDIILPFQ